MFKNLGQISVWVLLLTAPSSPCTAQQSVAEADLNVHLECGGQYECVEDRPLSKDEAERSYAYPRQAQSNWADQLAATLPTSTSSKPAP